MEPMPTPKANAAKNNFLISVHANFDWKYFLTRLAANNRQMTIFTFLTSSLNDPPCHWPSHHQFATDWTADSVDVEIK